MADWRDALQESPAGPAGTRRTLLARGVGRDAAAARLAPLLETS